MSSKTTQGFEPHDDRIDVKPRLRRAVCEKMTVTPKGGDLYAVHSSSGRTYEVDARDGRCTCPDAKHNLSDGRSCKHQMRVEVVRSERAIPAALDRDAVDELIGCAVETTPIAVVTDGGALVDEDTDRPDDCGCWGQNDLPCWPCARDGFDTPRGTDDE